mmetsp:Transcript_10582/g.10643  ORF Transcript_10582/g.10643 Transcript_10582/m.10643 type:complete len:532 (+) Transcript_10582:117-1712(+)
MFIYWLTSFVAVVGAAFCFLAFIYTADYSRVFNTEPDILGESVLSLKSYTSVILSIGIMIPISLEFVVDSYLRIHRSRLAMISMWTLLISIVCPEVFFILYQYPTGDHHALVAIFIARGILFYVSALFLIGSYNNSIWSARRIATMSLLYVVGSTLTSFIALPMSTSLITTIQVIRYILLCSSILLFLYHTYAWTCYIYFKVVRHNIELSIDESSCSVHVVLLLLLVIAHIPVARLDPGEYIISIRYMQVAHTALVILFYSLVYRRELLLMHCNKNIEMKRMLVGYFSHKMLTPLNSISIGLQLLHRVFSSLHTEIEDLREVPEIITDMTASCEMTLEILNHLLTYEKVVSGTLSLTIQSFSLKRFLEHMMSSSLHVARSKGVILEMDTSACDVCAESYGKDEESSEYGQSNARGLLDRALLRADEARLTAALDCLISSAIARTPLGRHVRAIVTIADAHIDKIGPINDLHELMPFGSKRTLQIQISDGGSAPSRVRNVLILRCGFTHPFSRDITLMISIYDIPGRSEKHF